MDEKKKYVYYQKDVFDTHYMDATEVAEKLSGTLHGGWVDMDGNPYEEAVEAWLECYEDDYLPGGHENYAIYKDSDDGLKRVYPCADNSIKILNDDLDNAKRVNEDGTAESSVELNGTVYHFKRSSQANKYHELSKKKLAVSIMELRSKKRDQSAEESLLELMDWLKERPILVGEAARNYEEEALAIIQRGIMKSGVKVILPKNATELNEAILQAGHRYHNIVTSGDIII